jgi:hypothetical protein
MRQGVLAKSTLQSCHASQGAGRLVDEHATNKAMLLETRAGAPASLALCLDGHGQHWLPYISSDLAFWQTNLQLGPSKYPILNFLFKVTLGRSLQIFFVLGGVMAL